MFCIHLRDAKYPEIFPSVFEKYVRDPGKTFSERRRSAAVRGDDIHATAVACPGPRGALLACLQPGAINVVVNYPALKGGASCFMANTCTTEM